MPFLYSTKWRVIATIFATFIVLLGLVVADVVHNQKQVMYHQLESKSADLASLLALNAALPMINNDLTALGELIDNIGDFSDIHMVFLLDNTGRVRASNPGNYFNQVLSDPMSQSMIARLESAPVMPRFIQQTHAMLIDTLVPIRIKGKVVGYSRILMSTESIDHQVNILLKNSAIYMLIAMLLGGVVVWLVIRKVMLRLLILSEAARQVSRDNFDIRDPGFSGKDEVSMLGRAFMLMIASVKQQIDLLSYQATHDSLTGLPNRRFLIQKLESAFKRLETQPTDMVALLLIDLDNFKAVNDSFGHETGDQLLIGFATLLKRYFPEEETVVRLGGDEFCIIIESVDDVHTLNQMVVNLISVLKEPMLVNDRELFTACSIGVSFYPTDANTPTDLLRNADTAMYQAKARGKNSYQFYTSDMTVKAYERIQLEGDLRRAINNEEFIVYYQPQMNSQTNRLIGLEALIRWQHPEKGLIPPIQFLPVAVETGLIVAIDRLIMNSAIKQFVAWYAAGLNPGVLSLNLSIKQLQENSFLTFLQQLLQDNRCRPEWIELEITEGEVMMEPEKNIAALSEIRALGISLAIDDFGTGYSSLAYLKRLPVNKLKIDQSFVRNLPNDQADGFIVHAMQSLAQSFNMRCIAEGVETEAQKDFLLASGCVDIQGYFYSKPLPVSEITPFIRQYETHL